MGGEPDTGRYLDEPRRPRVRLPSLPRRSVDQASYLDETRYWYVFSRKVKVPSRIATLGTSAGRAVRGLLFLGASGAVVALVVVALQAGPSASTGRPIVVPPRLGVPVEAPATVNADAGTGAASAPVPGPKGPQGTPHP
jgi:hypothetical protein